MPIFDTIGPDGFGTYAVDWETMRMERSEASSEGFLVPGFVDIHLHGAFGHDFMSGSAEGLLEMAGKLALVGYEAFLPTTVTAPLAAIQDALAKIPADDPRMPGFHLEGPFISPKHPGAQPQEWIVGPSPEWDEVLDDPRLRVITLAPEMPHGLESIRRVTTNGAIASLGHTDATFDQVQEAVTAGATHTTHTYNAMRPLHHREAGTVGAALLIPELTCEIIYDRIHVSRPAAELLLKNKGADGIIAVSDSTMASEMTPGEHVTMWGLDCVVGDRQVRLMDGTLAGSGITLYDAFRNLAEDFGIETAIRLCCLNPRRALGMREPKIWLRMDRNLAILEILSKA